MQILGNLFIVAAPSGAGKTSLVSALVQKLQNVVISISHTTRPMRPAEKNAVNYYFVSEPEFESLLKKNDFIEYAKVYDYYYGTSKQQLNKYLAQGTDVILEIDWQGARQIKELYQDVVSIYIVPPSMSILEERLKQRGQDNAEVIYKRLKEAQNDISHFNEFDYFVVNDNFATTLEQLQSIFNSRRLLTIYQKQKYHELIDQLLVRN